jgi:hypothetical protein
MFSAVYMVVDDAEGERIIYDIIVKVEAEIQQQTLVMESRKYAHAKKLGPRLLLR